MYTAHENSQIKLEGRTTNINKQKMGPRIKIFRTDESDCKNSKTSEINPLCLDSPTGRQTRCMRSRMLRKNPPKCCADDNHLDEEERVPLSKPTANRHTKKNCRLKTEADGGESFENRLIAIEGHQNSMSKVTKAASSKKVIKKSSVAKEKKRPFICDVCSRAFEYSTKLKQHAIIHTDHRPFECGACTAKFRSKADLSRHLRIHTRETPYVCEFCDKKFIQRAHLVRHTRTHTLEVPFECNFCSRRFNDNSHLTIHKRLHTGLRPYQCDKCDKSFISSSNLQIHKRSHTLERRYMCAVCTHSFSTSGSLVRHIRTHTQEKPYQCEYCSKRFCDGSNLRVHRFIHTRERRPHERSKSGILALEVAVATDTVTGPHVSNIFPDCTDSAGLNLTEEVAASCVLTSAV